MTANPSSPPWTSTLPLPAPGNPRRTFSAGRDVLLCAKRGALILCSTAWCAARWASRALLSRRNPRRASLGDFLAELCEALGPTFIKGAQILSSRPDLLSPAITAPLARLQDQVAPAPSAAITQTIEQALGGPLSQLFAAFDPVPLASASIAQVHRAELWDGRQVAVKVRRPGARETLGQDLALLRWCGRVLARLPGLSQLPIREMIEELAQPLEQQLDFAREASNNQRFQRHFHGVERIRLPALVPELSTDAVLTMELLTDLAKVDAHALSPADSERAVLAGLRALYKMIFLDGFIHADLHPGNVFLRAQGELVLLDFGLIAELSAADRRHFVEFFLGMVTNDGQRCAQVVLDTALALPPRFDRAAFVADMVQLIAVHASLKAEAFEVTAFVFQLFAIERRHRIRGSTAFTMTLLSLAVYEGIVKLLCPTLDFQKEARGYLIAAKYQRD